MAGTGLSPALSGDETEIAHSYSVIADYYDEFYSTPADLAENDVLFAYAKKRGESLRVVDIGCGTGVSVAWGIAPPERYIGIDPSIGMIETARKLHPEYSFITDDIGGALPDEAGLLIGTFGPLVHIPDPYGFALGCARACHLGGRFLLMAVPRPGEARITGEPMWAHGPTNLTTAFKRAGFTDITVRGFTWRFGIKRGPRWLLRILRRVEFETIGRLWPDSCDWLIVEGKKR